MIHRYFMCLISVMHKMFKFMVSWFTMLLFDNDDRLFRKFHMLSRMNIR